MSSTLKESWFDYCPNCNKKYTEGGYRIVGKWFNCPTCGKQIKNPLIIHVCRACNNNFSFDDAIQREVYSYSLNRLAKDEIDADTRFLSDIKKMLTNNGYSVRISNVITGTSGIEQKFDFVFSDKKKTMAIDTIFSSEPIQEIEIIKEQNKVYDTQIESYLMIRPKLNEQASMIAKAYNIKVIEFSNTKDGLERLTKLVREHS
jgi:hypothetical protein